MAIGPEMLGFTKGQRKLFSLIEGIIDDSLKLLPEGDDREVFEFGLDGVVNIWLDRDDMHKEKGKAAKKIQPVIRAVVRRYKQQGWIVRTRLDVNGDHLILEKPRD